jgi:hypothetical protein
LCLKNSIKTMATIAILLLILGSLAGTVTASELDGRWMRSDGTGVEIKGNRGIFYSFGPNWREYQKAGLVKIGSLKFRSIDKVSASEWTLDELWYWAKTDNSRRGVGWSQSASLTLADDGKRIIVYSTFIDPIDKHKQVSSGSYELEKPLKVKLAAPLNNESIENDSIVFSWRNVKYAKGYQLQVIYSEGNRIFRRVNIAGGSTVRQVLPNFPADGTAFKWRVRARNAAGWGKWSAYRHFTN